MFGDSPSGDVVLEGHGVFRKQSLAKGNGSQGLGL